MVDKGKIIRSKITETFRGELSNLMNKYTPMADLVESQGENNNLMESIKNLDTRLEDAINDLRMQKIITKKVADQTKDVINNLVWG
jgi:ribosome maturation protein Sdo1